jgi:hypothetical protein
VSLSFPQNEWKNEIPKFVTLELPNVSHQCCLTSQEFISAFLKVVCTELKVTPHSSTDTSPNNSDIALEASPESRKTKKMDLLSPEFKRQQVPSLVLSSLSNLEERTGRRRTASQSSVQSPSSSQKKSRHSVSPRNRTRTVCSSPGREPFLSSGQ